MTDNAGAIISGTSRQLRRALVFHPMAPILLLKTCRVVLQMQITAGRLRCRKRPIVAMVLWGLIKIAHGSHAWRWYSLLLSAAGIAGGLVHLAFLVAGYESFATWFSTTLIVAFLLTSLVQLTMTIQSWSTLAATIQSHESADKW